MDSRLVRFSVWFTVFASEVTSGDLHGLQDVVYKRRARNSVEVHRLICTSVFGLSTRRACSSCSFEGFIQRSAVLVVLDGHFRLTLLVKEGVLQTVLTFTHQWEVWADNAALLHQDIGQLLKGRCTGSGVTNSSFQASTECRKDFVIGVLEEVAHLAVERLPFFAERVVLLTQSIVGHQVLWIRVFHVLGFGILGLVHVSVEVLNPSEAGFLRLELLYHRLLSSQVVIRSLV